MGFISFNENYYRGKIEEYENSILSASDIYTVKQLLKVLDDLSDEGYTNLNEQMEADFSCLTRLRNILHKSNEDPFPIDHERLSDTVYGKEEYELEELLANLVRKSVDNKDTSDNQFLEEIHSFAEWIGWEKDTAYVFLMRDALLPYALFSARNRDNIYPWLISRRFLEDIAKRENVDDDIRLPLYEALESGNADLGSFAAYCKDRILPILDSCPKLKTILTDLLSSVEQNKIIVIESGYMGTIPIMLMALDKRVDFRMFTTAPFLYETYKDKIFCRKYEDVRRFETVYSQDLLLQYSSFHDGRFYVKVSADKLVRERSLSEIRKFAVQI